MTCADQKTDNSKTCDADFKEDTSKDTTAATAANYNTTCCMAMTCADQKTDNSKTCDADFKEDTSKDTTAATAALYNATCCMAMTCADKASVGCGADKKVDSSKAGDAAT